MGIYIYIEFLFLPNNSCITKIYIAGEEAEAGNGCVCLCYFKGDLKRLLFQDITSLFA
jgi:hypothetical protein